MRGAALLRSAREMAGLSQADLARRAGTSRPTLSAYEHGHKSPRLDTTERILTEAGFALTTEPIVKHRVLATRRRRPFSVLDHLPRLPLDQAFATVTLPVHLSWSGPRVPVDLADRRARARLYEVLLREGGPGDLVTYIDGALLIDLWDELVVPREVRDAWQVVIDGVLGHART